MLSARSLRTVDGEGLDVVREWVPADLAGPVSRDAATRPGIWETLTRHGHRIATVRQVVTAGLASDEDAELLGVAPGDALLLVRRFAADPTGRVLALSDHRYLAQRFALEVEFSSGPSGERRRDRRAHRHPRRPLPRSPSPAYQGAHRMKVLVTGGAGFIGSNFVLRSRRRPGRTGRSPSSTP